MFQGVSPFEATVNEIASLISFLICSLLVYGKATDFYMLILYLATLPQELMISNSFLVEFLGYFMHLTKEK
jgi:hypothetical protein